MRRCLSSLLLLLTLMASVLPLLALAPLAVPACCRAGGKHHCAAMMKLGGDGFGAQAPVCPLRRNPATVRAHAALQSARPAFATAGARAELKLWNVSDPVVRSAYALPKRGPPVA